MIVVDWGKVAYILGGAAQTDQLSFNIFGTARRVAATEAPLEPGLLDPPYNLVRKVGESPHLINESAIFLLTRL